MNSVLQRVYEIGIIPVIAFNSADEALPLCKALMDGGLPAAEVTFRTACAEDCIKKIHEELPEMLLGAGTVLTMDQADRAMAAGASFIVAPGFDPEVCQHVIDKGGIMMPGTATAGEMQQAMNMGCEVRQVLPCGGQRRRGQAEEHRRCPQDLQVDVHRRRQRQERQQLSGLQPDHRRRRHLDVQERQDQGRCLGRDRRNEPRGR